MKNQRLYITLGDDPGGVFKSQVTDVCQFLNDEFSADIGLLAFISLRKFLKNRRKIKEWFPNATVVPMVPKLKNWSYNKWLLSLILRLRKVKTVICRNPLATNLALKLRDVKIIDSVIYDGRGAVAEEWAEYKLVRDKDLSDQIYELEKNAVRNSDYRIAVSQKLTDYWRDNYGLKDDNYEIIPCTLSKYPRQSRGAFELTGLRNILKLKDQDIVIAYAGSTAGWQSFEMMREFLQSVLVKGGHYKVLFLSKEDENNQKLREQFPGQVKRLWVAPEDVHDYLSLCDYGLLLREPSITNKVAAPTKFAEYLAAGLSILVSDNLGDYSEFVNSHGCGMTISNRNQKVKIEKITKVQRDSNIQLAYKYFSKDSNIIKNKYKTIIDEY